MIKTPPYFNIGDIVTYMSGATNRRLVAKVEYIQYDFFQKEWIYSLAGVPGEFSESQLFYWTHEFVNL